MPFRHAQPAPSSLPSVGHFRQLGEWLAQVWSDPRPEPIRRLRERHRSRLDAHLLDLNARDRYLRFGYSITDAQVHVFVANLDFRRDEFFGLYDRRRALTGAAHLAFSPGDVSAAPSGSAASSETMAEFAVSVAPQARGQGLGARLFAHAAERAQCRGVDRLFIHALSENTAMLRIAHNAGARVERHGSESEAWLQLRRPDQR